MPTSAGRERARGMLLPHGALRLCGAVAGATVAAAHVPSRCVILAANHTGQGPRWSLMADGAYDTPLGEVPVDEALAQRLLGASSRLSPQAQAHRGEHAVELPLLFLQVGRPAGMSIVPIVIGSAEAAECLEVGRALGRALEGQTDTLLLASCDLSRYEPPDRVARRDAGLIDAATTLDGPRFLALVREASPAVCGSGAIACLLAALVTMGGSAGRLVRYGTSAEGGGDPHSAVGYAGMLFS